jgi:hypothetical protein
MLAFPRPGAHRLGTLALRNCARACALACVCWVALGACTRDPEETSQSKGDTVPDAATATAAGSDSDAAVARFDAGSTSSTANASANLSASSPSLSVSSGAALPSTSSSPAASVSATATPSGSALPSSSTVAPSPSMSWVDVVDPPEGLTDCQETETLSDSCFYQLKCLRTNISVACDPAEDGGFSCSCDDNFVWTGREFGIFGVELAAACRAGIDICRKRETELSAPECSLTGSVTEADHCARTVSCVATGAIESGALIEVYTRAPSSECEAAGGENRMACDCSNITDDYLVVGTDASRACDAILDVCNGAVPVGEAVGCDAPTLETTDDSCGLTKLCGLRTELDAEAGIFALRDPREYSVVCNGFDDPVATCGCTRPYWDSWFGVTPSDTAAACQAVDAVCFGDAPLELAEDFACDTVDVATTGPGCTSVANCSQTVTFDEATVFIEGSISAECGPTGSAGEWECGCVSNIDYSARFTRTSSDPIALCLETQSLCETLVDGVGLDPDGTPSFTFGPLPDAGAP